MKTKIKLLLAIIVITLIGTFSNSANANTEEKDWIKTPCPNNGTGYICLYLNSLVRTCAPNSYTCSWD